MRAAPGDAPERVELRAPVERAAAALERARHTSGSELSVRVEDGVAGTWAPRRVEQIVESLLSNAIKYGGGKPIAVEAHGGTVEVASAKGEAPSSR